MMQPLSLGVVILGLVIGTAYGPLSMMAQAQPTDIASADWWLRVAAAAVSSFASSALAIGGVIAAAYGLPIMRSQRAQQDRDEGS